MFIVAEAGRCVNGILKAKTEESISGALAKQSLRFRGNPNCSLQMTNIPEYSVIEFTMNSYSCSPFCWCRELTYTCYPITIRDIHFSFEFNLSSTTPQYIYTNGTNIVIFPSSNTPASAVIEFNITYRGE